MTTRLFSARDLQVPDPATDEQITLVHDADYLERMQLGTLTSQEVREIGFPWSSMLMERSRRSVGGTIAASRAALEDGGSVNLAGGTHHATSDRGQGFCVFNDSAIAARTLQKEGRVNRIVILDCDVHQGNGTAAIFSSDPTVFTFSIHGEKNYPFRKTPGDMDIGLPDGTGDEAYNTALRGGLRQALAQANADLAIYLAGADPYQGDRLGRLNLSKEGLAERDRIIFSSCWRLGIPVATVMAGGYGHEIGDTVDIHFNTVMTAAIFANQRYPAGNSS